MNPHRGEVRLELEGAAGTLIPTFAALAALEAAFGANIITLAEKYVEGKATLSELHQVLQTAGDEHAKAIPAETLVGKNYLVVQKAVAEFFAAALGIGGEG